MPKNIVVCCDGTSNEYSKDLTNVVKLFSVLVHDPARQIAFYHPGLGTMPPPGALTPLRQKISLLLGLAFGAGLEDDIRNAYAFLMNNFEPGDRVYLFGFSRGAYTVRAVASLLHAYGLIRRGNETLVPYATRMLAAINNIKGQGEQQSEEARRMFALADGFKATFSSAECRPWFVGVWDTVSSVGWIENPLHLPYTANNPDIAHGRHAVAIDERRAFFRQNLWWPEDPPKPSGPTDLKQVWFPGVHSDVGGGYPEKDSGLAKLALEWMLNEATALELLVDPVKVDIVLGRTDQNHAKPDPNAALHESLTGAWWLAEIILKRHYDRDTKQWGRRMNLGRRRTMPPKPLVHHAAWERAGGYSARLPADAVRVE
jgi:uncharacterized protein (DUF2235 family)